MVASARPLSTGQQLDGLLRAVRPRPKARAELRDPLPSAADRMDSGLRGADVPAPGFGATGGLKLHQLFVRRDAPLFDAPPSPR